ncbi:MAG TPA: hypothetical protein VFF79_12955 [Conexibacter sp.]|jgi:hypothetical protein|nr:hypothetical protein [Conexibacter sp.]
MTCAHENFEAAVDVTRLHEHEGADSPHAFVADVRVWCRACRAPLGFKGLSAGVSFDQPMCSPDALEARLPLMSPSELSLVGPLPAVPLAAPPAGETGDGRGLREWTLWTTDGLWRVVSDEEPEPTSVYELIRVREIPSGGTDDDAVS